MTVMGVDWAPLDYANRLKQEAYLKDVRLPGLRKLTPNMGAYVNEVFGVLILRDKMATNMI
jgi:hypothetical protein